MDASDHSGYSRRFFRRLSTILPLLVILPVTFAVYSRMAGHEFISLDDARYAAGNPRVSSGLSLENVIWAFKTLDAEFWHPLTWLSYMIDTELFGPGPGGYLLTNLLLHLFNSALVFICFRRFTDRVWESSLIAAVFALHPLHVEPVAWISERKELLCASFWLLALLAYDEYRRFPEWRRYLAVMIFFVMGLMAKPMIVTLPFVLLLLDYWPLRRDGGSAAGGQAINGESRPWRRLIIEKIPLFVISAAGSIVTLVAQQRGGGLVSPEDLPLAARIPQVLTAYAVYLKKSIWPGPLAVFYPPPDFAGLAAPAAVMLAPVAVTVLVLFFARRHRYLLTGWFWFLGTLVPVIGLVKIGDFFIADRYMYMPLTGILVMVVFSLKMLIDRLSHRLTWVMIAPALVAGICVPATMLQLQTWQNSETLYLHALRVTDNNFLAHYALGNVLAARQNPAGAISHFLKAVEIRPDKVVLQVTLGKALTLEDRWREADDAFNVAARLAPDHPAPWFYLGCARAAREKPGESLAFFIKSLKKTRQQGRDAGLVYSKAMDYYEKGMSCEARDRPLAGQYYLKGLALLGADAPRRQLSRLVVGGYDQWLSRLSNFNRGVE